MRRSLSSVRRQFKRRLTPRCPCFCRASFLRYLPTDIVESVLHWWDHVCGDSDLTKAASTMCALLFCYRQQRFSRAQKEQIAVVMRQWNQKTLSLVARSKVPFAYALLTYSDLYCGSPFASSACVFSQAEADIWHPRSLPRRLLVRPGGHGGGQQVQRPGRAVDGRRARARAKVQLLRAARAEPLHDVECVSLLAALPPSFES